MAVTSWGCGTGCMTAAIGGARGALQPHGITARLANAVFLSACKQGKQDLSKSAVPPLLSKPGTHSRTCEKPLADGCGDLKGLRRQISSDTLYSLGSIDLRLISSLQARYWHPQAVVECCCRPQASTSAHRFVSIAAILASLRCCISLASEAAAWLLEDFLLGEDSSSSESLSDCPQLELSSVGQDSFSANVGRNERPPREETHLHCLTLLYVQRCPRRQTSLQPYRLPRWETHQRI